MSWHWPTSPIAFNEGKMSSCLSPLQAAIAGHSMGGHGALTLGLKNPDKYVSISAFAPISNPISVPWGQKAFKGYLGEDKSQWKQNDATELAKSYDGPDREILVDQGTADSFLKEQLDPAAFIKAVDSNPKLKLSHRMQVSSSFPLLSPSLRCISQSFCFWLRQVRFEVAKQFFF